MPDHHKGGLEDYFVKKNPVPAAQAVHAPSSNDVPFWEKPKKRPASSRKKKAKPAKPKAKKPSAPAPAPKPPASNQPSHLVREAPGDQTIAKNASLMNFLGNVLDEHDAQMDKINNHKDGNPSLPPIDKPKYER